jgi:rifampicin phosphotransferase
MQEIMGFSAAESAERSLVGGKAANLALLSRAGFEVPPGFTVTTHAYAAFIENLGLDLIIRRLLESIDCADAKNLEDVSAKIRELITRTPIPLELAGKIQAEYARLGSNAYVAVRSSGSAEDLAEASFAGLHDTYLDIQGADAVIAAVQRCWASLWTARATSYRHNKGFDRLKVQIAVVVQTMVEADVAGVMFTGNPMNAANDELVINASWGLGEAIVGGITTPDEFVVKASALRIVEKKLGSKSVRVVRNKTSGNGTVTEPVPESERAKFCLADAEAAKLAALGQQIERHYEGFPQDVEWAYVGGKFYVLQARPITGVEFSWDCDINAVVPGAEVPDDQLWGRALADEGWAGACTPLMFSWRGLTMVWGHSRVVDIAGYPHLGNNTKKLWYFCKGKAYYNVDQDRGFIEELTIPAFRRHLVGRMPKGWRDDVLKAPFDFMKYINMYVRYHTIVPDQGLPWIKLTERFQSKLQAEHDGLTPQQLRALSGDEIKAYIAHLFKLEWEFGDAIWPGMVLFMRDVTCLMDWMIAHFYTGGNANIATDLLSGTPRRGATARENIELYGLAVKIRGSDVLRRLFDKAEQTQDFFGLLGDTEDGRAFRRLYDEFIMRHGHRGQSDRDLYFLRRAENPSVDFRSLKALLSADPLIDPAIMEGKVNARREAAKTEIIEHFAKQPFGSLKVEIFKLAHEYVLECIIARDEERHFHDRASLSTKRGYAEIGRRLIERGVLESDRDHFFLTQDELYALFDGMPMTRLIKAKIAARMRDFDRVNDKVVSVALFLRRGLPCNIDKPVYGEGVLRGTATSRGVVTGTARVVKSLGEIPRVRKGEIIVVNATDPGWTPVFMIIKGIVLETGGMLAHGSLLAREYGFPAVQIEDAMQHIPDGATITVDGDAGVVTVH